MEKPSILVIDDEESITTNIAAFLKARGYDVTAVNDGEDALQAVHDGRFSIIISDIYIDRVTGLDVLEQAKQAGGNPLVILMTARGSVRTTVEAEIHGAFDYVAKPVSYTHLRAHETRHDLVCRLLLEKKKKAME